MLNTGTVTMSLADIDALRDKVKTSQEQVKNLEKELEQVKADKRVVKVTMVDRATSTMNVNVYGLHYDLNRYLSEPYRDRSVQMYDLKKIIDQNVKRGIEAYTMNSPWGQPDTKTEYINFEDVQAELRQEAEKAVATELGTLKHKVATQQEQKAKLEAEHQDLVEKMRIQWKKQKASYQERIQEMKKEYDDLLHDRDTRSRELKLAEEIEELKLELEKEKNKSWFQKLFGK